MSQHSKDKLPTPGLKRKLKTHTIETKFQAIADVERGEKFHDTAVEVSNSTAYVQRGFYKGPAMTKETSFLPYKISRILELPGPALPPGSPTGLCPGPSGGHKAASPDSLSYTDAPSNFTFWIYPWN
uniref:Uncharacterized protein n=1 Tax=Magallana gigas TaxID=29159 RepID=K1Q4Z8_MAGGI